MLKTNYHTHTTFCDGKNTAEEMVNAAIKANFDILGFSSHSMYPFGSTWHLSPSNHDEYCDKINWLKETYRSQLEIYLGFEADFIDGICNPHFSNYREFSPDYLIGAVHYVPGNTGYFEADGSFDEVRQKIDSVFKGNVKKAVQAYFAAEREMLKKGMLRTIDMQQVEMQTLPDTAFSNCYYLSHFVAPRTLKRIGYLSFSHCSNLNYAVFHDGLQEIGGAAFSGCKNLLAVRLPATTTRIGYNAYTACQTLLSVTIPEGVTEIGNYAFSNCKQLYAINLPKSLSKVGKELFKNCERLTHIRLNPENPYFTVNEKKELIRADSGRH